MKVDIAQLIDVAGIGPRTIQAIKEYFLDYDSVYNPNKHLTRNNIYQGDCLELMDGIPDKAVDMILCDLPYGTTACDWDIPLALPKLWAHYTRIIKDTGVICLFASQPFTTKLIASNLTMFKYCWYWLKSKPNGWQHAKNKPMTKVEEICVFSKAPMGHKSLLGTTRMEYNPQGVTSIGIKTVTPVAHGNTMGERPNQVGKKYEAFTGFPHNVLEYPNITSDHPTQKPVELCEYLIKTYTQEQDLVLDNTMGSGTTCLAAKNLNRDYLGIELNEKFYQIAQERLI